MRASIIPLFAVLCLMYQPAKAMSLCEGGNRKARAVTCLVDGDTGWERGVKWRTRGWDTPEYAAHADCHAETLIAAKATKRVLELMSAGYELIWHNEKGGKQRELVSIRLADGRMVGDILLSERLAVRWPHKARVWCGG